MKISMNNNFILIILSILLYIEFIKANQEILENTQVNKNSNINNFGTSLNYLPLLPPGKCWTKHLSNLQPPLDAVTYQNEIYIQGCCNGYEISLEQPNECIPICPINTVISLSNNCVEICPVNCLNGQCFNNQCLCNSGYDLDEKTEKFCKPICSKRNIPKNANCTEPDKYDCIKGFQWNTNHTDCLKHNCSKTCLNGYCSPITGICECRIGYKLNTRQNCIPICEGGCPNHSRCIRPGRCKCRTGYHKKMGLCVHTSLLVDDDPPPSSEQQKYHPVQNQSIIVIHHPIQRGPTPRQNNTQYDGIVHQRHQISHNDTHSGEPFSLNHINNVNNIGRHTTKRTIINRPTTRKSTTRRPITRRTTRRPTRRRRH